ncbi:myotubularin-related protein 9-like isoform X2 [Paramacrobiotus metropolitanus]|uniref:myotubularin-related protein 9-like isoform X2 n=1 Tax=Paramacrobiotus metropolitanus TaxID=2943436 RepID=UPI00244649AE|nr:myotubularin-related protein 9-like isoform X2 [Paramacrobiotus metropolitanus]
MEFSDLIKSPYVESVTLRIFPDRQSIRGRLCITGHHMIISAHAPEVGKTHVAEVWILHMGVDVSERRPYPAGNGGSLLVKCKDLKVYQLDIPGQLDFMNVASSVEKLSHIADIYNFYPFFFRPMFEILEDGWTAFPLESEFAKWTLGSDEWRISFINRDFESYPTLVVVPKSVKDEVIAGSAMFREGGRFPVLSYLHENKAAMLRSGQPLVGPGNRRSKEDEQLLLATIRSGKRAFVFDTRSVVTAGAAKNKGGGYELEVYYSQWRRIHHSLENWSSLHTSLSKLVDACADRNLSVDKWLSRLESSGWLNTVGEVLHGACVVAQCLHNECATVLVHGAEGMDLTLCITSLVQIILDSDTRTIRGFEALVEREWLQAGHPFGSRWERSAFGQRRSKHEAPTFLLFLDCVRQLHNQYTSSFQFTPNFLKFLFENACASEYGTFLCNNSHKRHVMDLRKKTISLWSYVNHPKVLASFLNPVYEPNHGCLWPSIAPMSLILWRELYLHSFQDISAEIDDWNVAAAAKARDDELRDKVIRLRKEMLALERELVMNGLCSPNLVDDFAKISIENAEK